MGERLKDSMVHRMSDSEDHVDLKTTVNEDTLES